MRARRPAALTAGLAPSAGLALLVAGLGACGGPFKDEPEPAHVRSDPVPLSREAVLGIALQHHTPGGAVQQLDSRRFAFTLDVTNVEWLREQGAPPEVVLYLKKRANAEKPPGTNPPFPNPVLEPAVPRPTPSPRPTPAGQTDAPAATGEPESDQPLSAPRRR